MPVREVSHQRVDAQCFRRNYRGLRRREDVAQHDEKVIQPMQRLILIITQSFGTAQNPGLIDRIDKTRRRFALGFPACNRIENFRIGDDDDGIIGQIVAVGRFHTVLHDRFDILAEYRFLIKIPMYGPQWFQHF